MSPRLNHSYGPNVAAAAVDDADSAYDDDDIYDKIALCLSHRLNHSCAPNVAWSFDSVKNVIEVNILPIKGTSDYGLNFCFFELMMWCWWW